MATTLIPIEPGSRWGMLTALERMPSDGKGKPVKYRFRCECGNEVIRQSQQIRAGTCTNCGCQRSRSLVTNEVTAGDQFGDWTVLREVEKDERQNRRERSAECLCTCGEIKQVRIKSLYEGISQGCGCRIYEKTSSIWDGRKVDMEGGTFGLLTYIEDMPRQGKQRMARCSCRCGNETVVQVYGLLSGNVQSCGCYAKAVRAEGVRRAFAKRKLK